MAHGKQNSLQSIMKKRQQANLVGRTEEISLFRENLYYSPEDERRKFIFNIFGQGGVGKTTLLRHFLKLAEDRQAHTAWIDENDLDILSVMAQFAEKIGAQSNSFKLFNERYRTYLQHQQELEADPEKPKNSLVFISQALTKAGIRLGRQIPVGGAVFDLVDENALATQVSEWSRFVAEKVTNKDEVRLVQHPIETLTPLLLEGLQTIANKHLLVLFFDTYEHTSQYLEKWLLQLLEGYYGDIPANIVITVAGRNKLNINLWSGYESFLCNISLEPFTNQEAREYLSRKKITDERLIEAILQLSGCLPLLVATLASENPLDLSSIEDPSDTAIERFLKWEDDPAQRQILLHAAFPRHFNLDIIAELVSEENPHTIFTWLIQKPFIIQKGNNWVYHELARSQMLRYQLRESPQNWSSLHKKLAEYYEGLRETLNTEANENDFYHKWQASDQEAFYHRLCQSPHKITSTAINEAVRLTKNLSSLAEIWKSTMFQAIQDSTEPNNISKVENEVCTDILMFISLVNSFFNFEEIIHLNSDHIISNFEEKSDILNKYIEKEGIPENISKIIESGIDANSLEYTLSSIQEYFIKLSVMDSKGSNDILRNLIIKMNVIIDARKKCKTIVEILNKFFPIKNYITEHINLRATQVYLD